MQEIIQGLLRNTALRFALLQQGLVLTGLALKLVPVLVGGLVAVLLGVMAVGAALSLFIALIAANLLVFVQLKLF